MCKQNEGESKARPLYLLEIGSGPRSRLALRLPMANRWPATSVSAWLATCRLLAAGALAARRGCVRTGDRKPDRTECRMFTRIDGSPGRARISDAS